MPKQNVRIITLGCAKNEVDSEEIAGVLAKAGYDLDGDADTCDVTIINTCGFLEAAKRESIETIKEAVRDKRAGKTGRVIVAGCLAQRLGADLERVAPGADSYVGVGQMARFADILEKPAAVSRQSAVAPPQHLWADVPTRARTGAPWSAYLKVSEGCDHRCTFCTIPSFRGAHQSKPIERVLAEARHLAKTGAREINLIAQDVTQYGYDLYREFTMPRLLRELSEVDVDWIRLLYCYPNRLTDEVIDTMASLPKVCNYIDVPLQHVHPEILRAMKRPWEGERYLRVFERLRKAMPDAAIRTTFIVGFPGETEEHFLYLLAFLREACLDRVGAFLFSREPGTPSYDLPCQVPERIKQERYGRLMEAQQAISLAVNRSWIGRKLPVLIEGQVPERFPLRSRGNLNDGIENEWSFGRSHRDAPEIDGLVYVEGDLPSGSITETIVSAAAEYDLYAAPHGVSSHGRLVPLRQVAPAAAR